MLKKINDICATEVGEDSSLQKLIRMVQEFLRGFIANKAGEQFIQQMGIADNISLID